MAHEDGHQASLRRMMLAAIGVVYGDIGTSPLYTFRECLGSAHHGLTVSESSVLGVLSLVIWSLIIVITGKYVMFIMRADNRGEGGILSLMALAQRALGRPSRPIMLLGLAGAALFYGDSIITPAMSVLSAVEGLEVVAPGLERYVLPITLGVLISLFAIQSRGTDKVGVFFGPIVLIWFAVLAILGVYQIIQRPEVFKALDPRYGWEFFHQHGFPAFAALGAVVLAITGGEALYADMGHFGRRPIRVAWNTVVFPALALNYFGQAALVLSKPETVENPFFLMAPDWALIPLVALATMATVIASQAVISGAYSVTQQAIQLGFCPRLEIRHTSDKQVGQIFMPRVNWGLLLGVVALVVVFRTSSNLAAAYGIAVTGTMTVTTLLAFVVARHSWGWGLILAGIAAVFFLVIDVAFLSSNLLKILDGGWMPLAVASGLLLMMITWRQGRGIMARRLAENSLGVEGFARRLKEKDQLRVPGTAVFMTSNPDLAPYAMLHNLKHNKVLHERNVMLTVEGLDIPRVADHDRVELHEIQPNFMRLIVRYGFMETPDIPHAMAACARFGVKFDMMQTSFFLGRETLIPSTRPEMSRWREEMFILMARNATSATEFFRIPTDRVVELGARIPL